MSVMKKDPIVVYDVNGIAVEQKILNGFINGTTMCVAYSKDVSHWLENKETLELFIALAIDLSVFSNPHFSEDSYAASFPVSRYPKVFPDLINVKRGSPENGGGTWIHPDLAIPLAQWCSKPFAIQVGRWIREWAVTSRNPITSQTDIDRIKYRTSLKDESRLRMTAQIKLHLEKIKKYDDKKFSGLYFANAHDCINKAITTETAKQMRERLSLTLGREVKETELIRDYFPAMDLQKYIAICEITANLIIQDRLNPLESVHRACLLALPIGYLPQPIDFDENIKLVHGRVEMQRLGHEQSSLL